MELQETISDGETMLNGFLCKSVTENPNYIRNHDQSESKEYDDDEKIHSEIPVIQLLFKQEFNKKLLNIENSDADTNRKNEEKIEILQSYLHHIEEQNDILVSTMIELEKEAQQRVRQMEKRLKSSAKTTMEAVVNVYDCEQEMRRLVNERLYIEALSENMRHYLSSLKMENSFLRDQNFNLNHDVQALLHIIHHARSTGHWEVDCVTFCEVTPEQVFGPVQPLSQTCFSGSSPCLQLTGYQEKKEELNLYPGALSNCPCDVSSTRCNSLPDIGNIYSFANVIHKTFSCKTLLENEQNLLHVQRGSCSGQIQIEQNTLKGDFKCNPSVKFEDGILHGSQSEPYLYMLGNKMYAYKPCESTKIINKIACQNVDLKFAIESDKACSWNLMHRVTPIRVSENCSPSLHKISEKNPEDNNESSTIDMDANVIVKKIKELKDNLTKAEDKAAAKEILIENLKTHLTSAIKEVDVRKEQIEEISSEQKRLQNQVRDMMTLFDLQSDELEETKNQLEGTQLKLQNSTLQVEHQSQIIRNLQEALVQSKRAFDAIHPNKQFVPVNTSFTSRESSKHSIVDI